MPQASPNENSTTSQAQVAKAKGKATKKKPHIIKEIVVDSQAQRKKSRASKKESGGAWEMKMMTSRERVNGSIDTCQGGMNEVFNNPVKQGVNLWAKVATQLATTYPDLDKDSESCRKKFKAVLAQ
ncbi:hypothetical protein L7F22_026142 [Adiantum nelumboides]|nr:hypothetical protein [Adiantum nelumboides]